MAFTHGKDSAFKVDNTAGSLTDVSQYTDNVEGLPGEVEFGDTTAFGDEGHRYLAGLENGQFTVGGNWDPTLDAIFGASRGTARSFEFGPAGAGSGAVKYSGECFIKTYTVSSPVADKVTWSADLMVDGVVTRGTFV